jgi:hypothetical protein
METHPDVTTRHGETRAWARVVFSASSQGRGGHPEILFSSAFSKAGLHRPMQNAPFTFIFFAFLLFRLMSWSKETDHGNAG